MRNWLVWFLLAYPVIAMPLDQVPNPLVTHNGWFSDTAGVLKGESVKALDREIDAVELENGTQLTVVTVANTSGLDPKTFANRLFNLWGVGEEGANNGVLILLVTEARRIEIEVGDGANRFLTDAECSHILQSRVVPKFKQGDYNAGVVQAVRSVISDLHGANYQDSASMATSPNKLGLVAPVAVAPDHGDAMYDSSHLPTGAAGGLGLSLLMGMLGLRRYFRNKPRVCPGCRIAMSRLDEQADDAHLDDGQRREETLGSVDYDVWVCRQCDEKNIVRYSKWFSSFSSCGSCGYKALETSNTTVRSATTYSEGQGRKDENCRHCNYTRTSYYTIARVEESTSSSSSSDSSSGFGGGFGGGSSSGGGSGASW